MRAGRFTAQLMGKVEVSDKTEQTDLFLVGLDSLSFRAAEETHPEETGSFRTRQDFVGADYLLVSYHSGLEINMEL